MKRFILFIIVFLLFLGFIMLNLENTCDISFGFREFANVPVFVSILVSFMLGMLFAMPLTLVLGRKKHKKVKNDGELEALPKDKIKKEGSPYGID